MNNLVYGIHAIENLISTDRAQEIFILQKEITNSKITKIIQNATLNNILFTYIKNIKDLPFRIKKNLTHQNIFAIEKIDSQTYNENDIIKLLPSNKKTLILIMDSVQDPHNFGACIRSAHSAGVDFIIVPKDNSSPVTAIVKKVACGAVEHTKIVIVTNLARAMDTLKKNGIWIIGLAGESDENLYSMDLKDSIALVVGSEGSGIRQRTKIKCDFLAKLPMLGKILSLNVSVATGIALYETVRQRLV